MLSRRFCLIAALLTFALALSACSRSTPRVANAPSVSVPTDNGRSLTGPEVKAEDLQPGLPEKIILSNGAEITLQRFGGKVLHVIEGTFTTDSFDDLQSSIAQKPEAERREILKREVETVFRKAASIGALPGDSVPEVGYFQMMIPYEPEIFRALKTLSLEHGITVQPLVRVQDELKRVRALSPSAEEGAVPLDPRLSTRSFSGLERIGAIEFARLAEKDIGGGVKVDGSSVQVGITDTGITYNHPTFLSASTKQNRINHIADTTGEGTIYLNPAAQFTATAPADGSAEDLVVRAQIIATPKLPASPASDDLQTIDHLKIKVSAELRALLLAANASGAKLGVIQEDVVGSEEEKVDMNHNGKTDDKLYVLYFPALNGSPERVYFDTTGTADFRKSVALTDFNLSHQTMAVYAERVGFAFANAKLPNQEGSAAMDVRTVSIVGYDPGNHGSHVAGITAGRKTINNDSDDTLARGVAPEARIAMNRVCSNNAGCSENKGIAELAANAGVEVINMSLGGLNPFNDGAGVAETLINRLVSTKNIVFMISAGNSGPGKQTVGSPSTARLSLSIGASASKALIQRQYQWPGLGSSAAATEGDDFMLFFSSRGPTASGGFKPTLAAPGTELSSIQLNAAPGSRGGLDVYWGTSMAAPTATGAYALFLDAIKKYNDRHPEMKLTTDALMLRRILIESARPFDVNRLDLTTGERSLGQYIWADEGVGMINLPGAWKKLFEVRDAMPPTPVTLDGKPVELDYQVLTSAKAPNGNAYDGSRVENGTPVFASGLYLSASDPETLKMVQIARRLPESLASGEAAGELTQQLETTADEFVLRTVLYGSDQPWLKAGVMETPNCGDSPASTVTVLGSGVEIALKDGKGSLTSIGASGLNVCIDKAAIARLAPGDHGALIYAYRKVGSQIAPVASFIVPVYLNVPHQTLAGSTALVHEGEVSSFGVDRHYVRVPEGTSVLRIALEVPPLSAKIAGESGASGGNKDEACSGVELMAYEGLNTAGAIKSRPEARVANCETSGQPTPELTKRRLVLTRTNPRPGLWDVHVFGQYRFQRSKCQLRVDYVAGETSLKSIAGGIAALNGSLEWTLRDASLQALPDSAKSRIELSGLAVETQAQVKLKELVYVESPLGVLRAYPEGVKSVIITTGGSVGNDIDLAVLACPADAKTPDDPRCLQQGASGSSTDEERVEFKPKVGNLYAVQVGGFSIKDDGKFVSTETLSFAADTGAVQVDGAAPKFTIAYRFDAESSALLKQPLFGKYSAVGSLSIRMADDTVLAAVPVKIEKN